MSYEILNAVEVRETLNNVKQFYVDEIKCMDVRLASGDSSFHAMTTIDRANFAMNLSNIQLMFAWLDFLETQPKMHIAIAAMVLEMYRAYESMVDCLNWINGGAEHVKELKKTIISASANFHALHDAITVLALIK